MNYQLLYAVFTDFTLACMEKITIAIDGGAGVGKWVTARGLAKALWYSYVDTGAMWRALTLYILDHDIDIHDEELILTILPEIYITFSYNEQKDINEVVLNGDIVEGKIRTARVSNAVSEIALHKKVRTFMVEQQKLLVAKKGVVMEGRDIGSVVAPDAALKIHLTANIEVRAKRRQAQLREKWIELSLKDITINLKKRDQDDLYGDNSSSFISPDALEVDTTHTTIEEQVGIIVEMARKLMRSKKWAMKNEDEHCSVIEIY